MKTQLPISKNDLLAAIVADIQDESDSSKVAEDEFTAADLLKLIPSKSKQQIDRYIDRKVSEGVFIEVRTAAPYGKRCKIYKRVEKAE